MNYRKTKIAVISSAIILSLALLVFFSTSLLGSIGGQAMGMLVSGTSAFAAYTTIIVTSRLERHSMY